MTIFSEEEKENDLDDTFGNQNDANYQGEKDHPEKRIDQQIDCSQGVQRGYERVPGKGAASEMNSKDEVRDGCEDKKPA